LKGVVLKPRRVLPHAFSALQKLDQPFKHLPVLIEGQAPHLNTIPSSLFLTIGDDESESSTLRLLGECNQTRDKHRPNVC
jgi:phosphomevalonate kinase